MYVQFVGNFSMEGGGEVHVRCFGIFNLTLWDDVMEEFQPLTRNDVIMVNFGAWYPRFSIHETLVPWQRFQDVSAKSPCRAFPPLHSPTLQRIYYE